MTDKIAYRVIRVDKTQTFVEGQGDGYEVVLAPVYYGEDEKGPNVGDVLVPGKVSNE